MNERQKNILKIIIEEYIKTAHPVGSKSICDTLDLSSATIRNEMASLEEDGLLEKPHTSAGRIPSEKGYRYYVDNLMEPQKMTGEDMLKLQTIFRNQSLELNDVILKSIEIISEITSCASIALDNSSLNRLKKVEVVVVDTSNLIALVITDKGHLEHKNIYIADNIDIEEVRKMVDLMNNLLVGTPINDISEKLEFEIKPVIGKYIKQHDQIYNAFYNAFNDFSIKNDVHLAGRNNILNQPEFDNVNKIKRIVSKLEDKELIHNIEEDSSGINIYIGSDSKIDENVTIIKTKYEVDGEEGTIAIIGPKRMEYNRIVGILEYIKENIER
ncbi:MAG: heat-inducible transcriptional repressor HrcA [Bacilli bacterium]